mmetsp:Transcript_57231/g.127760  ORF Transcript_57231/g.127760 Transcript_57231/m.127760 type:complete len:206 (+) Transcript_57231:1-618(+)
MALQPPRASRSCTSLRAPSRTCTTMACATVTSPWTTSSSQPALGVTSSWSILTRAAPRVGHSPGRSSGRARSISRLSSSRRRQSIRAHRQTSGRSASSATCCSPASSLSSMRLRSGRRSSTFRQICRLARPSLSTPCCGWIRRRVPPRMPSAPRPGYLRVASWQVVGSAGSESSRPAHGPRPRSIRRCWVSWWRWARRPRRCRRR